MTRSTRFVALTAAAMALAACGDGSTDSPPGDSSGSGGSAGSLASGGTAGSAAGSTGGGGSAGAAGAGSGGTGTGGGDGGSTTGGAGSGGSAGSAGVKSCPEAGEPTEVGALGDSELDEISGLGASRTNAGLWYVHNDSGADAQAYVIDEAGELVTTLTFPDAPAIDWEDMAVGRGPTDGASYVYFADIGDNDAIRNTGIDVIRALEPEIDAADAPEELELEYDILHLVYPDGAHNAETLLLDPENGDLYIVTKSDSGSEVFVAPAPQSTEATITLEHVTSLAFGAEPLEGDALATSGDISADGRRIAIRTETSAFLWVRAQGETVAEALAGMPCPIPLADEEQGESLAFAPDSNSYSTTSEGSGAALTRVTLE